MRIQPPRRAWEKRISALIMIHDALGGVGQAFAEHGVGELLGFAYVLGKE